MGQPGGPRSTGILRAPFPARLLSLPPPPPIHPGTEAAGAAEFMNAIGGLTGTNPRLLHLDGHERILGFATCCAAHAGTSGRGLLWVRTRTVD